MEDRKDALRTAIRDCVESHIDMFVDELAEKVFAALGPDGQLQLRQARRIEELTDAWHRAERRVHVLENDIIKLDVQLAQARKQVTLDTTTSAGVS